MSSVVAQLFAQAAFDPEDIRILTDAYERARKSLHDKGQPAIVQEIIAKRIIALAKDGERDPDRLCADALIALGNKAVFER
jgi:hypothetical protein